MLRSTLHSLHPSQLRSLSLLNLALNIIVLSPWSPLGPLLSTLVFALCNLLAIELLSTPPFSSTSDPALGPVATLAFSAFGGAFVVGSLSGTEEQQKEGFVVVLGLTAVVGGMLWLCKKASDSVNIERATEQQREEEGRAGDYALAAKDEPAEGVDSK
ncbi:hypothetical protein JCM8547_001465 [Rhodosporidiobolus lusitaniae]